MTPTPENRTPIPSIEDRLGQRIYSESIKYSEWEPGDLWRAVALIELHARNSIDADRWIDPRGILRALGVEEQ